jgi:CRP-like cAMP-binding protein
MAARPAAARERVGPAIDRRVVFQQHPLFGRLTAEDIDRIAAYSRIERVKRGRTIFRKGDDGTGMMAVLAGRVKITVPGREGKEALLNIIGPGGMFGEIALLDGRPRTADATAMSECILLVLDRRELLDIIGHSPDFALRLIAILCDRLRHTTEQVEDVMFLDLPTRLAKALLRLAPASPAKPEAPVAIAISQRELGQSIGISRESINKQLAEWQSRGLVQVTKDGIALADRDALQELAGEN